MLRCWLSDWPCNQDIDMCILPEVFVLLPESFHDLSLAIHRPFLIYSDLCCILQHPLMICFGVALNSSYFCEFRECPCLEVPFKSAFLMALGTITF